jgi:alcohol dehydrogenase (NADP+)
MIESSDFRAKRIPLNHGAGHMPVLGFGTLIPGAAATISATRDALDALDEINRIQTRQRFNEVVRAGSPGFIPQGR